MSPILTADLLGWLECLLLAAAVLALAASWRPAPAESAGGPHWLPAGWARTALGADVLVAALAFVHGSVPMMTRLAQRADVLGLYVVSAALPLALLQVVAAWLLPRLGRARPFAWIPAVNLTLVVALGLGLWC